MNRLRGRIDVFAYAKVLLHRGGENPKWWTNRLDHIFPAKRAVAKPTHHASLPYADMRAFWPRLQIQDGLGARALELAILTVPRTGEVLVARCSEIDLSSGTWSIPAERMKGGSEHRVPLPDAPVSLLKKLSSLRRGDLVFSGQTEDRPLSNMAMKMVLRRMKIDVTPHGFRSTFRTWVAEQTNIAHEVAEAELAHTQGNKVVAAYQRGDLFQKRRELMSTWADYVEGRNVTPQQSAESVASAVTAAN